MIAELVTRARDLLPGLGEPLEVASTRRSVASSGAICNQERYELVRPWISTTGGASDVSPSSAQCRRTPSISVVLHV